MPPSAVTTTSSALGSLEQALAMSKEKPARTLGMMWWAAFAVMAVTPAAVGADEDAVIEAMTVTLEFSAYHGNNVLPEQIPRDAWGGYSVVDTRSAEDYARARIPGAVHMEWRDILARRAELPAERPVLLYCDTGSLSAQAAFALRVTGREDVYILTGGFQTWGHKGGLDAHDRARDAGGARDMLESEPR